MTIPGYLLGFVIASLIAALFHLWRGGKIGRLLLFVLLSWAGFWTGHLIGNSSSFSLGKFGMLNLGVAILGSLVFLILGAWLSKLEK